MRYWTRRAARIRALVALAAAAALTMTGATAGRAAPAPGAAARSLAGAAPHSQAPIEQLTLPDGRTANVFGNGIVQLVSKDRGTVEYRNFPIFRSGKATMPDREQLVADLMQGPPQPFVSSTVVVVLRAGLSATQDVISVGAGQVARVRAAGGRGAPSFTGDAATDALLGQLGVDRMERLFRSLDRGALSAMHDSLQSAAGSPVPDFSNAYRLHLAGTSVPQAVTRLLGSSSMTYASPDWRVRSTQSPTVALDGNQVARAQHAASTIGQHVAAPEAAGVPGNYAVASSAQSLLNAPGVNGVAAFDEIGRALHQLPGQGEIVTNVSIGDLTDPSAATNSNDPCSFFAQVFGPTTTVVNGQRFLDMPSMPLIPTFTADTAGNLNGAGEVCGADPSLGEVGLDFSMMSPLPHDQQRPGEQGSGLTDLLGIAPGASYRLVVPANPMAANSDVVAALLGAGLQTPRPNVITASLGFGYDSFGFSGRFLEDDPLAEAVIAALVQSQHIVVCISAGDGTRLFTTAAISASGGSAATNVVPPGGHPTNLNDIGFSTAPSADFDSGSIDVGGTTLDDIFAVPPQFAANSQQQAQQAYPETRWTGFTEFASGMGSRVNVSAPSDNVLAMTHHFGGSFDAVDVGLSGGTSASAPEVAAAAAVVMQVASRTGQPFPDPRAVRSFLESTGDAVPQVPQTDQPLHVGPQVDLGQAVETLLGRRGLAPKPSVARVAVAQRRDFALLDSSFVTDTDPTAIDLQGFQGADDHQLAWITIAPDWEGVPDSASYRLSVASGKTSVVLATSRSARLLPAQILAAAGLPVVSSTPRTVQLTYTASVGGTTVSTPVALTFGPADASIDGALAPRVPAVASGSTIPVTYDLTGVRTSSLSSPTLLVSDPGRVNPETGNIFHSSFTMPLTALKGTVQVPVSALQGGGIYGIGIQLNATPEYSDFAYTRVGPTATGRPAAPLLQAGTAPAGHDLEIPYGGSFSVSWDVSRTPGATGAVLEISAGGPGGGNLFNTFNNPNGTGRDRNGVDTGSVFFVPLPGRSGTVGLKGLSVGLMPTLSHVVRVLATRGRLQVGEAGEVSSITMDGVKPVDGGNVANGFGLGSNGEGMLTSITATASGQVNSSLEVFDQRTLGITSSLSQPNSAFFTNGWSAWGNDLGLVSNQNGTTGAVTSNILNPISSDTLGATWTPPYSDKLAGLLGAPNQADDHAAFFARDLSAPPQDPFRIFTSDLAGNTFGPLLDLSAFTSNLTIPLCFSYAENTTTATGVASIGDGANPVAPGPTIVTTDLVGGTSTSFTGTVNVGWTADIAVDSQTNMAVLTDLLSPNVGLYDLGTRTGTPLTVPGSGNVFATADSKHGLFVFAQAEGADGATNNNGLSAIYAVDEHGNVVSSQEDIQLINTLIFLGQHSLQIEPDTRTGFTLAFQSAGLVPFKY